MFGYQYLAGGHFPIMYKKKPPPVKVNKKGTASSNVTNL